MINPLFCLIYLTQSGLLTFGINLKRKHAIAGRPNKSEVIKSGSLFQFCPTFIIWLWASHSPIQELVSSFYYLGPRSSLRLESDFLQGFCDEYSIMNIVSYLYKDPKTGIIILHFQLLIPNTVMKRCKLNNQINID